MEANVNPVFLRPILILTLIIFLSNSALAEVSSAINGKKVNWKLLFGKDVNPISGIPSDGRGRKIPIVLVHGNRNEDRVQARWSTFLNEFNEYDKFDVWIWIHNTFKPIGFNGSTGTNASELADCIKNFILPYYKSNTKPILVAHSRGGLVCRSYMNNDFEGDGTLGGKNILGLITLGTPHHGTPPAVPDWAAASFSEGILDWQPYIYNETYGTGKHFDPTRIGDIGLAWDNMDGAIPPSTRTIKWDVNIAVNGYMDISPRDMNSPSSAPYQDRTIFFKDQYTSDMNYKGLYGTLKELNLKEQFKKKIVAIGAYDNYFGNNIPPFGIIDGFLFKEEHALLDTATYVLAGFDVAGLTKDGINYYANDGLVPLQSALFLNISDGSSISRKGTNGGGEVFTWTILIDSEVIESHTEVKKSIIFTEAVKDHLDLLDTGNNEYWSTIISEIKNFSKINIMSFLPSLLFDEQENTSISGMAAYYKFDNDAYDASGLGNHGTAFNGVSYVSGKKNLSASFDGVNDYIRIDNKLAFNSGDFTIAAWVKTSQQFTILSQWTYNTSADNFLFEVFANGNYLGLSIRGQESGTVTYLQTTSLNIPIDQWIYVAVTYDESDGKCVFYVNGQSQTLSTGFTVRKIDTSAEIYVGRRRFLNSEYTQGSIDELRVYKRVLSPTEILTLTNQ
jgi:pimeloyl-ACP methyl ester carboxylesterase